MKTSDEILRARLRHQLMVGRYCKRWMKDDHYAKISKGFNSYNAMAAFGNFDNANSLLQQLAIHIARLEDCMPENDLSYGFCNDEFLPAVRERVAKIKNASKHPTAGEKIKLFCNVISVMDGVAISAEHFEKNLLYHPHERYFSMVMRAKTPLLLEVNSLMYEIAQDILKVSPADMQALQVFILDRKHQAGFLKQYYFWQDNFKKLAERTYKALQKRQSNNNTGTPEHGSGHYRHHYRGTGKPAPR